MGIKYKHRSLKNKWVYVLALAGIIFLLSFGAFIIFCSDTGKNESLFTKWTLFAEFIVGSFTVIGGIVALYLLNQRTTSADKTAQANVESNQQSLFKDAITHLGHSSSSSVRLGGIYALYKLATDEKEKYCKSVFEILNAHVRETTQDEKYRKNNKEKPSNEIQTLLKFLIKKPECDIFLGKKLQIDFSHAFLMKAVLRNAQLQGANLQETQLQGANLAIAQLQGSNFREAQLQGANLIFADLRGASLGITQLQGAVLRNAQLQGALLWNAQLQGADLGRAQLQGADLGRAQLQGADLGRAQLQGVGPYWGISDSFHKRIQKSTGKETSVENAIFYGGLTQEEFNKIKNTFEELNLIEESNLIENNQPLIKTLQEQIGKPEKNTPPTGAITGVLTQEMADKIIAEYKASFKDKK